MNNSMTAPDHKAVSALAHLQWISQLATGAAAKVNKEQAVAIRSELEKLRQRCEAESRRLDYFVQNQHLFVRCNGQWFATTRYDSVGQFDNVRDAIDTAIDRAGGGES